MKRRPRSTAPIALSLFVGAAACGGGSPSQPSVAVPAMLQLTVAPSPAPLTTCDPPACTTPGYEIVTTLTVRETAGASGRVDSLTFLLRRDGDGAALVQGTISPPFVQVPFTARGTATIPFTMHVVRTDVIGSSTLTLTVNATDSGGRAVSATASLPVNAPPS